MRLRILCLLFVFALLLTAPAHALGRQELRDAWQEANILKSDASPYREVPDVDAFSMGSLTEEAQQHALSCLNFIRGIAGLEPVTLDPLYTLRAQNGALLLAANDYLDHNASRPEGMPADQYESAHMGTSLGNIAKFNWMKPDILVDGVSYFARDDGEANLAALGHRRWLLNPRMEKTGFGLANAKTGMSYVTMYAVDMGNADAQWDYVAWPCGGVFPVELMRSTLPWSVSLNGEDYIPGRIRIDLTEEVSGAEFTFEPNRENEDGYCALSTEACGAGDCLIFRPDIAEKGIQEYVQNQVWNVRITGLTGPDGQETEISYRCEMVSLNPQDVANIELSQLKAELAPGQLLDLDVDVIPAYADDLSVIWGSSDAGVASVNADGVVRALAPGQCTITAMSANGRRDMCAVTVK